jgi:hypothetical protein
MEQINKLIVNGYKVQYPVVVIKDMVEVKK